MGKGKITIFQNSVKEKFPVLFDVLMYSTQEACGSYDPTDKHETYCGTEIEFCSNHVDTFEHYCQMLKGSIYCAYHEFDTEAWSQYLNGVGIYDDYRVNECIIKDPRWAVSMVKKDDLVVDCDKFLSESGLMDDICGDKNLSSNNVKNYIVEIIHQFANEYGDTYEIW